MNIEPRQFTFEELSQAMQSPLQDEEIIAHLLRLQSLYTRERSSIALASRLSLPECQAYTHFYLPSNYQKWHFLMRHLPDDVVSRLAATELIDAGAGPGTFTLAFHDYFSCKQKFTHMIEINPHMQGLAKKLMQHYHPNVECRFYIDLPEKFSTQGPEKTLLFGHSLNEMGIKNASELIRIIRPRFVIFIEPGTPLAFSMLMDLSKQSLDEKFHCHYPCPSGKRKCPMLINNDWCHQLLRPKLPAWNARLAQMMHLDRHRLPLLAHFYEFSDGQFENKLKKLGRVIRFLGESKHAFKLQNCILGKNNTPELMQLEILKRHLNKDESKNLSSIELGMSLDGDWDIELSPDIRRVRIKGL